MPENSAHVVAVIGGAVSGSVATEILAQSGIEVVVIEQNARPYGKIEDGLPRWHVHQRKKEYEKIDARLTQPGVHFLPNTKIGRDLDFQELAEEWGLSAILLANGAWRDRPLPFPEADDYLGKGIEYQNPFIYWFNHKEEASFDGRPIDVPDGALVFGGGLASIDVVKVCQIESYQKAFRARGIEVSFLDLEKKGVPKLCEMHGIADPDELGVEGCVLLYRRRVEDMPLAQPPENATPEQMEKTINARRKLLSIVQEKLRFRVQDKTMPLELVTENGRVTGVKVIRTQVEGRKVTPIEGSEEVLPTEMVISSIGSIPEPIPGIEMKGEHYTWSDWDMGVYAGYDHVFGVGNVVTGQGNIRASLLHSKMVAEHLKDNYFRGALGAAQAEAVKEHLDAKDPLPADQIATIRTRLQAAQAKVGYEGDYRGWIEKVTPPDLQ